MKKGQISGALYQGISKGKGQTGTICFSGNPMEKEAEDKSGKIKAEKITGPDSMIVYKDNLFLRHLWKKQDPGMEIWQNCLKIAETDTGLLDKETGSR